MKRKPVNRIRSQWRKINVIFDEKEKIVFELDEYGKLQKKIRRQEPRDLSVEFQKMEKNANSNQFLNTNDQKSAPPNNANIQIDDSLKRYDADSNITTNKNDTNNNTTKSLSKYNNEDTQYFLNFEIDSDDSSIFDILDI